MMIKVSLGLPATSIPLAVVVGLIAGFAVGKSPLLPSFLPIASRSFPSLPTQKAILSTAPALPPPFIGSSSVPPLSSA